MWKLIWQMKISVFLITFNEEGRLPATLKAAGRIADEIVVVDSGSTDATIDIAQAAGAKVHHHAFEGYGQQKRAGEDLCENDWLLNLDADEVLSGGLISAIEEIKRGKKLPYDGYRLHILNVYPGHTEPRPFANDYNEVRLYNRSVMRYREHALHDRVEIPENARIGQLEAPIHHHPYTSFAQLADKLDRFSTHQAQQTSKSKLQVLLRLPFEFPFQFLKFYLLRRHFTGGIKGLQFSAVSAYYRWMRLMKMLKT